MQEHALKRMFFIKIQFNHFVIFVKFDEMLLNSIIHTLQRIFLIKWKDIMCLLFKQENHNNLLSYVQSLYFFFICLRNTHFHYARLLSKDNYRKDFVETISS